MEKKVRTRTRPKATSSHALRQYHKKRNFEITLEPVGGAADGSKALLRFVVQKHDASHLHYDFRLELDGVLKSWAVPKGPSLDPARKSLAIEVEDHPLEYGSFEGVIPKGQYGGGTVMVWDEGTWEPVGDAEEGYRGGKLRFTLHGKKLTGAWALVRMQARPGEAKRQWLLMKSDDAYASTSRDVLAKDQSAMTGRGLEEIAGDKDAIWNSDQKNGKWAENGESRKGGKMPGGIGPQLATLVAHPPVGEEWVHEIKFDGYRLLAYIADGKVRLLTRNQQDWTHKFSGVAKALGQLNVASAIIDGEVVMLDAKGRSDFGALQEALKAGRAGGPLLYAFDLLWLNGEDWRTRLLLERKERLELLLRQGEPQGRLRFSDHVRGDGEAVSKKACAMSLEGIISKRADRPYVSGRGGSWLKSKCVQQQEMVIVGYTNPQRSRKGFGALLLGYYNDAQRLVYAGRVGTGFDASMLVRLHTQLEGLERKETALDLPAPLRERRAAHWVDPTLVGEIRFSNWTRDGMLRHPSFVGLRSDKPAAEVKREFPMTAAEVIKDDHPTRAKKPVKGRKAKSAMPASTELHLTHPDKLWYADKKIKKEDVARYYLSVQEWMLPHLINRPLTLLRCPSGTAAKCFFQRNWTETLPSAVIKVPVKGEENHVMIRDIGGLLALVQINALEIHTWNCTVEDMEHPDQLVFDLDPAGDVAWKDVVRGAEMLRRALQELKLPTFLKTSGGKGLHLTIPIRPNVDWTAAKSFCEAVAKALVQQSDLFVANMRKELRPGKIYMDYQRNGRAATAIAPYSTRARPGAAVSMPIAWSELATLKSADAFTLPLTDFLKARKKDPWADFQDSRVDLRSIAAAS